MTAGGPSERARGFAGSWIDDLAAIVAAWLDARPIRRRLLLLAVLVLAGPGLVREAPLTWAALALLLLPRIPGLRSTVLTGVGVFVAVSGTAVIVLAPRDWDNLAYGSWWGVAGLALGVPITFGACRIVLDAKKPLEGSMFVLIAVGWFLFSVGSVATIALVASPRR